MDKLSIMAILVVLAGLMIPMSMATADPNILEGTVTDANGNSHAIGVTESGEVTSSVPDGADCFQQCMTSMSNPGCEQAKACVTVCNEFLVIRDCRER